MKRMTKLCLVASFAGLACSTLLAATPNARLLVKVTGFANSNGVQRIAVFNSEQAYKTDNTTGATAFRKCATKIKDSVAQCSFTVPYGTYAIKTYQDTDNSGALKKGTFGKPLEAYGFSNNPGNTSGARSWSNALFDINQSRVTQTLTLINP